MRTVLKMQSTSLVRHVFRLLKAALKDNRGIPWVLLENVRSHQPRECLKTLSPDLCEVSEELHGLCTFF